MHSKHYESKKTKNDIHFGMEGVQILYKDVSIFIGFSNILAIALHA
jgi:hypothetical protein